MKTEKCTGCSLHAPALTHGSAASSGIWHTEEKDMLGFCKARWEAGSSTALFVWRQMALSGGLLMVVCGIKRTFRELSKLLVCIDWSGLIGTSCSLVLCTFAHGSFSFYWSFLCFSSASGLSDNESKYSLVPAFRTRAVALFLLNRRTTNPIMLSFWWENSSQKCNLLLFKKHLQNVTVWMIMRGRVLVFLWDLLIRNSRNVHVSHIIYKVWLWLF